MESIERMNEILTQTITIKHSAAFKKIKDKMLLSSKELVPISPIKEWFDIRSLQYTFPDFFDRLFSEAALENRLDYTNKTIVFAEEDAEVFGFEVGTPISIFTLFEYVPDYFIFL